MIGNLDDLKFEGGYPTVETIQKLYDQLDLQRAAQAYLDLMPAMSMQALLDAHPRDWGDSETGGMVVHVESGEGKVEAIHLTCNTESICASLSLDLKQTGPAVLDVPPMVLGITTMASCAMLLTWAIRHDHESPRSSPHPAHSHRVATAPGRRGNAVTRAGRLRIGARQGSCRLVYAASGCCRGVPSTDGGERP